MASRTTTCDTHPAYNFTNDPIGKSSSTTSGQVQHYVPSAPSLNNYQFSTSSSSSSSSANNRVTGLPHFGQEYPSSVILSSSLTTTATASSSSLPVPPFHAKDQHYYHLQQEQQQHQHQQQPQQQQHYHHQHHQEYGQRSAKAMGKQPSWASDIYTGFDTNHYISYPPAPPGPPSSN
ncbi:uncharacterized protein BX664DRAFT_343543 [Halteromyces radiatus]|uniref:uncharacterized protein n=1 Tax=Halteromyces radiatus TaxID=101107 RepID=UPI0022210BA0|nr:uncharacterized protein BX664DRAFT_343543 [Halteromyces radiatus]KAI8077814.1 hypothetical protein BX664DRAFT_343543 [Halteromyces radiatus]